MKAYSNEQVLAWHAEYLDYRITARQISTKYNIKHETMLKGFRRLGLKLRPSGFRPNNCKGRDGLDSTRLRYLWLYKFAYKRRAARKQLEFSLTEDEFITLVTSNCFYCGVDWKSEYRNVAKKRINMLTVDRFDSSKGYTFENCRPACKTCNTIKMDIPFNTWIKHLLAIIKNHAFL